MLKIKAQIAFFITVLSLVFLVSLPVSAAGFAVWISQDVGVGNDLYSIWGTDGNNVYAVGKSGTILHYDGSAWSRQTGITARDLRCVWGTGDTDIYAVGQSGTILHYDGSAWSPVAGNTEADLYSVWGSHSSDIYAVGKAGTVLHYDGSAWAPLVVGAEADLYSVWGFAANHIFAAGSSGTILHYDGTAWTPQTSGTVNDLYSIRGTDGGHLFAVGKTGTVLHYDGAAWSYLNSGTASDLYGVWGVSGKDVILVGDAGTIAHYDGTKISPMNRNTVTGLRSVYGFSSADIFASGQSGTVLRYLPPVISSVSPDIGDQGESLKVTITGKNLSAITEARFGAGIAVNSLTVLNPEKIEVGITIVPGAQTGDRDVSVTAPGGSFTLPEAFTVKQALPVVTSINPAQGNQGTSLNLMIDGTNLTGASKVRLGDGIKVDKLTVLNSNQISAGISIEHGAALGKRDVSVTTPGGSFTLPEAFTVKQALPTVTSVSPGNGSQGATLTVNIYGTDLTGAGEVRFGAGIAVNSFTVLSPDHIEAKITIIGGVEIGLRDVSVTTPGGSFTLPDGFTIKRGIPVITSVSPAEGRQGETLSVVISGSNLDGADTVSFGAGTDVRSITSLSPTQLRVNLVIDDEAGAGLRDVSVTTPGGHSTLGNSFNIQKKPTSTLIMALLWTIIAVVIGLFIVVLNLLRKSRGIKL